MKISYNWIRKFTNFRITPNELCSLLISIGFETSIVSNKRSWTNIVSAKIIDISKHPNANKLFLCKVTDGNKEYSVICGAKNIAIGQIVPFAKIGATLKDIKVKKNKIRGLDSNGIICSAEELELEVSSKGILILNTDTNLGEPLENIFDKNDTIFEIEVMTNRGDCLSHLGIAREISAKLQKKIFLPALKVFSVPRVIQSSITIEVKSDLCLRYIGSFITDVKIKTSPNWLMCALQKNGLKSINNVVDITNYVMLELGQPLHVFDASKLCSNKIIIRNAIDNEKIFALDDKEYILDTEMLVTSDLQKPIAISGIIGGKYSSVDNKTTTVFIESGIFDANSIRKTSKKLHLSTDSSYRFERKLDWNMSKFAMLRAISLIIDIAGGNLKILKDIKNIKYKKTQIILEIDKIFKVLGYTIEIDEIKKILIFLGIDIQLKGNIFFCTVPSWRNDIKFDVDLIEEIVRIKGYDTVPYVKNNKYSTYIVNNAFIPTIIEKLRIKLSELGFSEVLNYTFVEIRDLEKFDLKYYYKILNPVSKENEVLRPSLLLGLYKNLLLNIGHGSETVTLFEYGKIFNKFGERKAFAMIMYGRVWQEWCFWTEKKIDSVYDFYFGCGVVRKILQLSNKFIITKNSSIKKYFRSEQTAAITYNGKNVGQFGILNPFIIDKMKYDIFYFEILTNEIEENYTEEIVFYKTYSKFPIVKRDISIVADKTLKFEKIESIFKNIVDTNNILKTYSLFSIYILNKSKLCYSFRLSYGSNSKTLTDKEVTEDMNMLLKKLDKELKVKLRK
ncbi:MAG: phenylalanine--tRNA ligase subunit beta [Endomicrobium sp.]|jgi:phenylalanyl-tRNA synthetase beta chain|nr:phenylalanine--tRNA ligase subunit beta [Endomicrobium sp.]